MKNDWGCEASKRSLSFIAEAGRVEEKGHLITFLLVFKDESKDGREIISGTKRRRDDTLMSHQDPGRTKLPECALASTLFRFF